MKSLQVGKLKINKNKCIIIAEAGVNHNCNLRMAKRLIKEAKDNGELFASIKPKELSMTFSKELKVEISPSQIALKQEIDKIGNYKIEINLYPAGFYWMCLKHPIGSSGGLGQRFSLHFFAFPQ